MKKITYPLVALAIITLSAFTFMAAQNWEIGKDHSVKFTGKYADGVFKTLKGTIVFDERNPAAAKFDITVDVASINTGNGLKNQHAKGEKWFDADKYPVIHFVSSAVTKTAGGYEAKGELEMHGVKKPLSIPFTFTPNGSNGIFKGSFKVNRSDYGISKAEGDETDFTNLDVTVPVTSR